MLGQFFVQGWAPDPLLWAQHDPWLVLPSILPRGWRCVYSCGRCFRPRCCGRLPC